MKSHDNLSPSKRSRWSVCPGSIREEQKYPDQPSGAAAIDGTHTHTLLDKCLASDSWLDPYSFVGKMIDDHEGEFVVDDARAERVAFALAYIKERYDAIECYRLANEERVDPGVLYSRDDLAGTCDVILLGKDTLEIIDYKDGMGVVGAKGNSQMEQYLIGAVAPLLAQGVALPFKTVRMTIIQPKLRERGMKGIDYHDFDASEIPGIQFQIMLEAAATDDPNAPLIPGDHCTYCKHAGACTARTDKAMEAAGIQFQDLNVAKQAADKEPNTMTDEQLRELIEAAPSIRQMLEAAEVEALRRMESGHAVPGLKLVAGRGTRSWAFSEEEMEKKLKLMKLPKEVIWKQSLISPAQVEKVSWTDKKGERHQLSPLQIERLKKEYIVTKEGKVTVALESDARPSVTMCVAGMFSPAETETPDFLKGN